MRGSYIDDRRLRAQPVGLMPFPLCLVLDRELVVARQRRARAGLVIFAKRVTDELFVAKDAPQVGMIAEANAEHVERLALPPVRGLPHRGHRIQFWSPARA